MEKIPTAEEFARKYKDDQSQYKSLTEYFQDFAKLHVKAALEAGANKANITRQHDGASLGQCIIDKEHRAVGIDRTSILKAYPLENIK